MDTEQQQDNVTESIEAQVVSLKTLLADAEGKLAEVNKYYEDFQALRAKLDDSQVGLNAVFKLSQEKKTEIEKSAAAASEQLTNITQSLERVKQNTTDIEQGYERFKTSKDRVEDPQNGLVPTFEQAKQLREDIARVKEQAATELTQISDSLAAVQKNTTQMEAAYKEFEDTKKKIDDPDSGLAALLKSGSELRGKIQEAQKSATNTLAEMKAALEGAQKDAKDVAVTKMRVVELEKESESLKDSIAQTLNLVTDSSLDDAFRRRSDTYHNEKWWWIVGLLVSIAALVGALWYIFDRQMQVADGFQDWKYWHRFLYTSPLVYAVLFCARQYSFARAYADKYAFKSVAATTITSYVKLLTDEFPDKKEEVLAFTLETIGLVYERPFSDKNTTRKIGFALPDLIGGKVELEVTDTIFKRMLKKIRPASPLPLSAANKDIIEKSSAT